MFAIINQTKLWLKYFPVGMSASMSPKSLQYRHYIIKCTNWILCPCNFTNAHHTFLQNTQA